MRNNSVEFTDNSVEFANNLAEFADNSDESANYLVEFAGNLRRVHWYLESVWQHLQWVHWQWYLVNDIYISQTFEISKSFQPSLITMVSACLILFSCIWVLYTIYFSVPSKGSSTKSSDMVKLEPMMKLVLHCIDRVRRFKLGKEVCLFLVLSSSFFSRV